MRFPRAVVVIGALCIAIGLGWTGVTFHNNQASRLPSWVLVSAHNVSSISVQGWGPGASGNYTIHPDAEQSPALINMLARQLPQDEEIKPYTTGVSAGGADWLVVQLKNGYSIKFANFPNDPTPIEYVVTLTNASGKDESSAMIRDTSGAVTSAIQSISQLGVMVRQKTH